MTSTVTLPRARAHATTSAIVSSNASVSWMTFVSTLAWPPWSIRPPSIIRKNPSGSRSSTASAARACCASVGSVVPTGRSATYVRCSGANVPNSRDTAGATAASSASVVTRAEPAAASAGSSPAKCCAPPPSTTSATPVDACCAAISPYAPRAPTCAVNPAGVAWLTAVVVTTPVAHPRAAARSSTVSTGAPARSSATRPLYV